MSNPILKFYLNGKQVTLENPSPTLLLIDFLRSPEIGLIGPKKGCGQGGCGSCTVILSRGREGEPIEHRAINSCLRPVCTLAGMAITTIEGTGGVQAPLPGQPRFLTAGSRINQPLHAPPPPQWLAMQKKQATELATRKRKHGLQETELIQASVNFSVIQERQPEAEPEQKKLKMNPVAHRLAINNGTQCGYCSVGFVMNMSAFLANYEGKPSKKEIEEAFDGNICRCTGYKSILTGMKTFASDWTADDEKKRLKCLSEDRAQQEEINTEILIPFPADAGSRQEPVNVSARGQTWLTPVSTEELRQKLRDKKSYHLVFANTSYGVYPKEFDDAELLVDIRLLGDLYGIDMDVDGNVIAGGGTTYTDFIDYMKSISGEESSRRSALYYMARRTAGTIVRNAASLAGNTMLVLHHIHSGEPFPSDLFTAMAAVDAKIRIAEIPTGATRLLTVTELIHTCVSDPAFAKDLLILEYVFPGGSGNEVVMAQKTALREVNSHSIVNSCSSFEFSDELELKQVRLVFGGIAPYPWRAKETEKFLMEKGTLSLNFLAELLQIAQIEVAGELRKWQDRMRNLPNEGFTDEYRTQLASGFLCRAVVNATEKRKPGLVPDRWKSAGIDKWGRWPVSTGSDRYEVQTWKAPVSRPYIKLMAFYQASGQVHYTHELKVPPLTKNGAFVQSRRALGKFHFQHPDTGAELSAGELANLLRERFAGFFELITHSDIPKGGVNLQGMGNDQPILARSDILYYGQVVALVLAESEQAAIRIAEFASDNCVGYTDIDWGKNWGDKWKKPILTIDEAIRMGSIFPDAPESASYVNHIWKITRPGTDLNWAREIDPLDKKPDLRTVHLNEIECTLITNTQMTGGQVHFYMETQACVAYPVDGDAFRVHPSSQSPMEMHTTVAASLGIEMNRVEVQVPQLGGGYGGKTEQAKFVVGPAAVAAARVGLPVRLALKRESDSAMIGKRHGYYGQYQIAADRHGTIHGMLLKLWGDGGAFFDCSFIVANCIQLRTDNAYNIRNFESQVDVVRTNKAPNTAMRSFGDIQGTLILENAIDDAACAIGMDPWELRYKNMYRRGEVTPYGQTLPYCYMRDVWKYIHEISRYREKRTECDEFNRRNRWTKRGVACIPVKYGNGYNIVMLEQAAAIISVYSGDGTISINQGGVDMGQGFMTKVEQVAAYVLGVPMEMIRIHHANTAVIPNPTSTGASTGTAYNGEAIKQAAEVLRTTLMEFGYRMLKDKGDAWCSEQGIDFWNHGEQGWGAKVTIHGQEHLIWQNLVQLAYQHRVPLVHSFNAPIRGGETPVPAMTFKTPAENNAIPGIPLAKEQQITGIVDSFTGYTFSAACSVVEVDVLTGETKILSTDLVYDMGYSLNPAIDIGQVEGAFIQGVGYVLTENLVWEDETSPEAGRLNTDNTWRYKPPAVTTIPLELNTYLYPRSKSGEVPENPHALFSSKEVGEPPLVLAASVFFALKAAVRASRQERGKDVLFRLDAPATVQEVRRALDVSPDDFRA